MMPFVFEDASRPESDYQREDATFSRVELNTRLQARPFDLRVGLHSIRRHYPTRKATDNWQSLLSLDWHQSSDLQNSTWCQQVVQGIPREQRIYRNSHTKATRSCY